MFNELDIQSATIGELATALSQAQGEMTFAPKTSSNPYFKSRYADLASVWEACRKPLSDHGLAVVQQPWIANGLPVLVTTLIHSSGEWMRSFTPILTKDDSAQSFGSGITYARRYALQSIVGLAADDDDGNMASGRDEKSQSRPQTAPPKTAAPGARRAETPAALTPAQLWTRLRPLMKQKGWTEDAVRAYMQNEFNVSSSKDMTLDQQQELLELMAAEPDVPLSDDDNGGLWDQVEAWQPVIHLLNTRGVDTTLFLNMVAKEYSVQSYLEVPAPTINRYIGILKDDELFAALQKSQDYRDIVGA
jgi:hypothetical protein